MVVSALLTGPAAVPAAVAEPMEQAGQVVGGYGDLLWMSLGLVVAVGVIAVIAARLLGGGRGWRRGGASGLMEVVARQPLEPRRSLYVVRVGQRRILVGTSELGVTMLTELDAGPEEAAPAPEVGAASFAELVKDAARQWAGKRKAKAAGVVAHRAEQAAGGASQKADDGAASQADDGAAGQAASASNREGARGAARAEERVPS